MAIQSDNSECTESLPGDVVQRHRKWLMRLISARTGSQALVEDVLQEVGLAVARSEVLPDRDDELKPWLCTIAIRQCALAFRKSQRRRQLVEGVVENTPDLDVTLDDPIYWLLDRERSSLVREALAVMDEEKRKLLIMKYVDGMTYGQLAKHLSVPAHVAEYRVVTAKKSLRKALIQRGIGQEDLT